MKKYNYLALLGLGLLLAQSGSISAGGPNRHSNWRSTSPEEMIQAIVREFRIDSVYNDFLRSAAEPNARLIMNYRSNSSNPYPSNVLRAAKDIARQTQGEGSNVYKVLESMLSYK